MKDFNKIKKLSDLLTLAVNDYKKIKKDKRYVFHPQRWHILPKKEKKCEVCLAGCVIAKELGGDISKAIYPVDYESRTTYFLYAVDSFLRGAFYSMLLHFFTGLYDLEEWEGEEREMIEGKIGKRKFKELYDLAWEDIEKFEDKPFWDIDDPKPYRLMKQIKIIKEVYKM